MNPERRIALLQRTIAVIVIAVGVWVLCMVFVYRP